MNNKITFGTDGIRGKAGEYPFTPTALIRLGRAIAHWAQEKKQKPCFLLGADTRVSSPDITQALIHGLTLEGSTCVDGHILPTPAILERIVHDDRFDFGLIISASHNPYEDNGIKLFDAAYGKLTDEDEEKIAALFTSLTPSTQEDIPSMQSSKDESIAQGYTNYVTSQFPKGFLLGQTIVLDCSNGATYQSAPAIFKALGAQVIPIGTSPNGTNINHKCGAVHPQLLQDAMRTHNAAIGFAFDGDGDRVIAVNKHGEIKDGDDLLALLLTHPAYKDVDPVVGTVMTNYGFEAQLNKQKKTLVRTQVGDKYIGSKLKDIHGLLGGETSGHIILTDYLPTGDGVFVALRVLESIMHTNNWDMISFEKYPQILLNIPVARKRDLSHEPYDTLIKKHQEKLADGRLIVRYSGTENLLRIMTEDASLVLAQEVASSLADKLEKSL